MPAERYYVDADLVAGGSVAIEGAELHHLLHVMRGQVGDGVQLVNGRGSLGHGRISGIEKKRCATVDVEDVEVASSPGKEVVLAQALCRGNRLDGILEKCTELGVTRLWVFPGELSERKKVTAQQLERMRAVTVAAMKQCGRFFLPEVVVKPPLEQWPAVEGVAFFGDLSADAPLLCREWSKHSDDRRYTFVIGPGSGFTDGEVAQLQRLGVVGVKLHSNVLRTDTAAIVAVGLLTHLLEG